ncbi:FAD-binding oxidoreductase [Pseudonocardia sp. HH130630-07]|uniref:FAD-binding oxidoreductase n=1 Tax=Pseudonocardia sp. HH130630-07 TaxID=1690815 RepID=UPI000814F90E|nr:FAD-binding protein [Pseudonocardia sp. HH130630-07]ANY09089.1 hypothetical protein AFB00_25695 [Pseudonocardia sp. HH130630-07]
MTTTTQPLHTALTAAVDGRVTTGAAPGASFQTGIEHRPEVTVAATGPADVAAVLAVADRHRAPVTVHATGHGLRSPAPGGVLLDTSAMSRVRVDPATATARIDAGATWADVLAVAAPHGLRPPNGSAPSVGVVGYLFGGGLGLTVRSDGWAADHVRSVQVVDAGGLRELTDGADFARLRGTGPVPGEVVTAVTLGLLPAGPLTGGGLQKVLGPADEPGDPAALRAWVRWTEGLPDSVSSGVAVVPYPDLPFLPPHLRGRRVLRVAVAATTDPAATDRVLAPLRAALAWDEDTVAPLEPVDSARVYAEPETPHAYLGDGLLVDGLAAAGLEHVATRTGPMVVTGIRHLGGAAERSPRVPDTVPGRDAAYVVGALAPFGPDVLAAGDAHREVARTLDGFTARSTGPMPAFRFGPHPV